MSAEERESGNGIGKWEGEKGPPLNLAWGSRGLSPALNTPGCLFVKYLLQVERRFSVAVFVVNE